MTEIVTFPARSATAEACAEIDRKMGWSTVMQPAWAACFTLSARMAGLRDNLTVAETHPGPTMRCIRLEMAQMNIAGMREQLAVAETAIAAALAEARREEMGGGSAA